MPNDSRLFFLFRKKYPQWSVLKFLKFIGLPRVWSQMTAQDEGERGWEIAGLPQDILQVDFCVFLRISLLRKINPWRRGILHNLFTQGNLFNILTIPSTKITFNRFFSTPSPLHPANTCEFAPAILAQTILRLEVDINHMIRISNCWKVSQS